MSVFAENNKKQEFDKFYYQIQQVFNSKTCKSQLFRSKLDLSQEITKKYQNQKF